MDAEFSEFTYGFALTNELVNLSNRIIYVAPDFPSLIHEGKQGGYDVNIQFSGYPLFIQFKLSEYMITKSAKEWDIYNVPYYRFSIRPSSASKQHELLLNLERSRKNVFYAAPALSRISEINNAYFARTIVSNSTFVRPLSIGSLPDNKEHKVVFQSNSNVGYVCSSPVKIDVISGKYTINALFNDLREEDFLENSDFFIELGKELLSVIEKVMGGEWQDHDFYLTKIHNTPAQTVSCLLRLIFNCNLYLLLKKDSHGDGSKATVKAGSR